MKQTKRHKLCFGTDKGKTFQNRINTGKNSGDSKTVTLVQKKHNFEKNCVFFFLTRFELERRHGKRASNTTAASGRSRECAGVAATQ